MVVMRSSLYFTLMKTITITGPDKIIYNILKENRIRIRRYDMEVTGDVNIEKPSITLAKAEAKTIEEAVAKKKVAKKGRKAKRKAKESKELIGTKEEKFKPETK